MVERRRNFGIVRRFVDLPSLMFLDESGAQSNLTRRCGRTPRRERCVDAVPHGHWQTTTMLSAIRLDGVIREATVIVNGAMTGEIFTRYAEHCLAPALRPGDVVAMDNSAAIRPPA